MCNIFLTIKLMVFDQNLTATKKFVIMILGERGDKEIENQT